MSFFEPHQTRSASSSSQFFKQINTIIDWKPIEEYLVNHYKPGKKQRGQKAYHPMILFKIQLISVWYGLSDVQTEDLTMDCISFCRFCGLELMDSVPD
ncbi:MAG: transposase, partial [Flavobacteriaceae bacterium]|nr:transposase [Flavobacteriaceae bacterium]